jgi:transposase
VGEGVGQGGRGRRLAETDAPKGFVVLPRRWVVERTLSWIDQNRRMSKNYERTCASGEALVYAAMIRLMTRRLVRI